MTDTHKRPLYAEFQRKPAVPHVKDLPAPNFAQQRLTALIDTLATASWTDGRRAMVTRVRNSPHVVLRLEQAGRAVEISFCFHDDMEALQYANTDPLAWRF